MCVLTQTKAQTGALAALDSTLNNCQRDRGGDGSDGRKREERRGGERTKGSDLMLWQRRERGREGETLGDGGRKRRESRGGEVQGTENRETEGKRKGRTRP